MSMQRRAIAWLAAACIGSSADAGSKAYDPPIDCQSCAAWNEPQAAFRIHGDTFYVGTAGLSSILVDTGDGLLLFDGALPQSAPLIDANIRALGFDTADVVRIFLSHAHYDHVGGAAALQRLSEAPLLAHEAATQAVANGMLQPDDPQYDPDAPGTQFPAVARVTAVADGGTIRVGDTTVRAVHTPGHTPGGMSWIWQSCDDHGCLDIVYADSLGAISAEGYRFTDGAAMDVRESAAKIAALDCGILLATHPVFFDLDGKLAAGGGTAFIDASACTAYAAAALRTLERRLAEERGWSDRRRESVTDAD